MLADFANWGRKIQNTIQKYVLISNGLFTNSLCIMFMYYGLEAKTIKIYFYNVRNVF